MSAAANWPFPPPPKNRPPVTPLVAREVVSYDTFKRDTSHGWYWMRNTNRSQRPAWSVKAVIGLERADCHDRHEIMAWQRGNCKGRVWIRHARVSGFENFAMFEDADDAVLYRLKWLP